MSPGPRGNLVASGLMSMGCRGITHSCGVQWYWSLGMGLWEVMIQGIQDLGPGLLLQDQLHHHLHGTALRIPTLFQAVFIPTLAGLPRVLASRPPLYVLLFLVPWLLGPYTGVHGVGSKPSRGQQRAGTAETPALWGSARRGGGGRPASWRPLQTAGTRDPPRGVEPWPGHPLPLRPSRPARPPPAGGTSVLSSAPEDRRTGWDPFGKALEFWGLPP